MQWAKNKNLKRMNRIKKWWSTMTKTTMAIEMITVDRNVETRQTKEKKRLNRTKTCRTTKSRKICTVYTNTHFMCTSHIQYFNGIALTIFIHYLCGEQNVVRVCVYKSNDECATRTTMTTIIRTTTMIVEKSEAKREREWGAIRKAWGHMRASDYGVSVCDRGKASARFIAI